MMFPRHLHPERQPSLPTWKRAGQLQLTRGYINTVPSSSAGSASKATHASEDTTLLLRQAELESSYRSAQGLGFDDLLDPRQLRNVLLDALEVALTRRPVQAEPVQRVGYLP